jgi:hypothetical protein
MIKGGYAQKRVTVSTNFVEPISITLEPVGEIADWIIIPENQALVSYDEPYIFSMEIEPPKDVQSGNYTGQLKITTSELSSVNKGAGSSIIAQIILLLYVDVTGEEIIACTAGGIDIRSTEIDDPFSVYAVVDNTGNTRFRPEVLIDVWDQYRSQIFYSTKFLGDIILPTTQKQFSKNIKHDLEPGQYFADVFIPECELTRRVTFDVLEKGGISDNGKLLGIRTNPVSYLTDPLPIQGLFRNDGRRIVLAQFKGQIQSLATGRIIEILESEELSVNPGETIEFNMFYLPQEEGEFQITGRVVYNNKITFDEASNTVKIVGTQKSSLRIFFFFIGYIIIGLIIMIIISKIRKARKKKKKKIF